MSGGEEGAGRLLVALEGGYNTRVTSEAAAACLEALSSATAIQRCARRDQTTWCFALVLSIKDDLNRVLVFQYRCCWAVPCRRRTPLRRRGR